MLNNALPRHNTASWRLMSVVVRRNTYFVKVKKADVEAREEDNFCPRRPKAHIKILVSTKSAAVTMDDQCVREAVPDKSVRRGVLKHRACYVIIWETTCVNKSRMKPQIYRFMQLILCFR